MQISLLQTDIAWNDPAENLKRCGDLVEEAVAAGSKILIFPEMFTCGFSMPTGDIARESEKAGRDFLRGIATKYSLYAIGSIPEVAADGRLYNTALTMAPDGTERSYRKIHLFSYGDETTLYSPGSTITSAVLSTEGEPPLRCVVYVCYDLRFSDLFLARAHSTDLFVIVANWPASRREHWLTLLKARAIETQCFVAGVNRVGNGGGLSYSGDSAMFAPDGSQVGHLPDRMGLLNVSASSSDVVAWRNQFPALRDRRDDLYATLKQ
jgi:predicted amidohydrolase